MSDNISPEEAAKLQKQNCVFCKIIAGDIPSNKVYEDDKIAAILDIYPAARGHMLVVPKEHVPIMPLIPPEVFKHLFGKLKYLNKAVKQGLPSTQSNIFIANGPAAGQQSPHFILHIIPRDSGDGLDFFDLPHNEIDQSDLVPAFKNNLTQMMRNQMTKDGKMLVKQPDKKELAKILEQNQELMEMLIKDPEQVKTAMQTNAQLKALFQGIDIDKLSMKLRENVVDEQSHKQENDSNVNEKEQEHTPGIPMDKPDLSINQDGDNNNQKDNSQDNVEQDNNKEEASKDMNNDYDEEEDDDSEGELDKDDAEEDDSEDDDSEEDTEDSEQVTDENELDRISRLFT